VSDTGPIRVADNFGQSTYKNSTSDFCHLIAMETDDALVDAPGLLIAQLRVDG
jgi:hypothetical protein